jgi:hypothetical protein
MWRSRKALRPGGKVGKSPNMKPPPWNRKAGPGLGSLCCSLSERQSVARC